jgi:hypothetical protein
MKRFYLALAMLAALPAAASAQTILNEGFETTSTDQYSPNFPDGWSTVDSYTGNNDRYRWNVYYYEKGTMTGTHCASVDSPMFTGGEDGGEGPREEILLTPELNLDNTYQLSFDWMAASKAAIDEGKYDFQVRIVTDGNVEGAETIWSFNNATQLKENGNVPYPWTAWTIYKTMIDLSKWQGKNIKVAFVYKMLKTTANVLDIDNVVVKQFTPATGPKGVLSKKQYNFGEVYMDSRHRRLADAGLRGGDRRDKNQPALLHLRLVDNRQGQFSYILTVMVEALGVDAGTLGYLLDAVHRHAARYFYV